VTTRELDDGLQGLWSSLCHRDKTAFLPLSFAALVKAPRKYLQAGKILPDHGSPSYFKSDIPTS
jgi:hypothetical protein